MPHFDTLKIYKGPSIISRTNSTIQLRVDVLSWKFVWLKLIPFLVKSSNSNMMTSKIYDVITKIWRHIKSVRSKIASSCTSEQCAVTKFYVLLGKSFTEIRDDLHKVYGDSRLANSAISRWMRRFKEGRESMEDDKHAGRPVTITTE